MDNPRPEKVAVVDEVRHRLSSANAAFLTEYRGLKVKELATLRRSLSDSGGEYKIYKNTLVRFAARDLGLAEVEELLVGPTGVTFVSGDAAAVAKALRDFSRTHPLLVIKGGLLGDRFIDPKETAALAELPSREVLLARFAGGLAAPLHQLAGLLSALPRNLAYGLKALVDHRVAGGEALPPAESDASETAAPEATASSEPSELADAAPEPEASESPDAAPEPEAAASPEPEPEAEASPEPEAVAEEADPTPSAE
ncbi:MAG: 50S ribosomal protein L10 [Acidimicrobiales bacterium]